MANKYKWHRGAILRTTRDIELESGEIIPKHSIIRVKSRREGYIVQRIAPPLTSFRIRDNSSFEEIPQSHWNAIFFQLNDWGDTRTEC